MPSADIPLDLVRKWPRHSHLPPTANHANVIDAGEQVTPDGCGDQTGVASIDHRDQEQGTDRGHPADNRVDCGAGHPDRIVDSNVPTHVGLPHGSGKR